MSNHDARQPIAEESISTNEATAITPWATAHEQIEKAEKYWLATVEPDSQPHVMPVFGVWLDGALCFTASPNSRKAKNMAQNARCVITVSAEGLDLIVEGEAVKVKDDAKLQRIADLYAAKYDWHITVEDGAYNADYGAPSAGPPPYEAYEVRFTKAFGFAVVEPYGATRWRFA